MTDLEPLLHQAERRALATVILAHPEWTLEHLSTVVNQSGPRRATLCELTLGELLGDARGDGDTVLARARLERAKQARGEEFDAFVRQAIHEAHGSPVGAAYLRVRVGGPRWKLQASLRRLVNAGEVEQRGKTSATCYRIARQQVVSRG